MLVVMFTAIHKKLCEMPVGVHYQGDLAAFTPERDRKWTVQLFVESEQHRWMFATSWSYVKIFIRFRAREWFVIPRDVNFLHHS